MSHSEFCTYFGKLHLVHIAVKYIQLHICKLHGFEYFICPVKVSLFIFKAVPVVGNVAFIVVEFYKSATRYSLAVVAELSVYFTIAGIFDGYFLAILVNKIDVKSSLTLKLK